MTYEAWKIEIFKQLKASGMKEVKAKQTAENFRGLFVCNNMYTPPKEVVKQYLKRHETKLKGEKV